MSLFSANMQQCGFILKQTNDPGVKATHNCISVFSVTFCLHWFRITEKRKDKVTLLVHIILLPLEHAPEIECVNRYQPSECQKGKSKKINKRTADLLWESTQAAVNAAWHDCMGHVPLETYATMASDRQEKSLVDIQQQLRLVQTGTGLK